LTATRLFESIGQFMGQFMGSVLLDGMLRMERRDELFAEPSKFSGGACPLGILEWLLRAVAAGSQLSPRGSSPRQTGDPRVDESA
jgi:hypothetical protein